MIVEREFSHIFYSASNCINTIAMLKKYSGQFYRNARATRRGNF